MGTLRCQGSEPTRAARPLRPGSATHSAGSVRRWDGNACRGKIVPLAHELSAGQQGRLSPRAAPKSPISLPWPISPGFFAHLERTDMTIHKMRHMCRNTHCRLKLPTPVENEHHAFCTKGCHAVFYRTRCQVCEEPIRRKTERQPLLRRKCKSERRRFPAAYSWPEYKTNETGVLGPPSMQKHPTIARASLPPPEAPILRGLKQPSFGPTVPGIIASGCGHGVVMA